MSGGLQTSTNRRSRQATNRRARLADEAPIFLISDGLTSAQIWEQEKLERRQQRQYGETLLAMSKFLCELGVDRDAANIVRAYLLDYCERIILQSINSSTGVFHISIPSYGEKEMEFLSPSNVTFGQLKELITSKTFIPSSLQVYTFSNKASSQFFSHEVNDKDKVYDYYYKVPSKRPTSTSKVRSRSR